jgi:hypothetical protein
MDTGFVSSLRKGDAIEGTDILTHLGILPEDVEPGGIPPEVRLAGKIERELHRLGKFWTVSARAGCVTVLTDHDAYHHNRRRHRSGIRKFRRALDGMKGVDTRKFTTQDRDEFELVNRKIAAQYLAITQAKANPEAMVTPAKIGR